MNTTKTGVIVTVLIFLSALAGCGGGDSSSADQSAPTAKALAVTNSPDYSIIAFTKVSESRVNRTVYDYVFKVDLIVGNKGAKGAIANITGVGAGSKVISGRAEFGDVAAGQTSRSANTITIRHDRSYPFISSSISWNFSESDSPLAVGVTGIKIGAGQNGNNYVIAGSDTTTSALPILSGTTTPAEIVLRIGSLSSKATIKASGPQWVISILGSLMSVGESGSINIEALNVKTSKYAAFSIPISALAPRIERTVRIDKLGGELATFDGRIIKFMENDIGSLVTATLREAVLPGGAIKYQVSFSDDISQSNLNFALPEPAAYEPSQALTTIKAILSSNSELSTKRQTAIASIPTLATPYKSDKDSLGFLWREQRAYFIDMGDHRLPPNRVQLLKDWAQLHPGNNNLEFHEFVASQLTSSLDQFSNIDISGYEPVLFVHGFLASKTTATLGGGQDTWKNFPALIMDSAAMSGRQLIPFEFRWATDARFTDVASDLAWSIKRINRKTGKRVHVIAHSFGGVLVRTLLQQLNEIGVPAEQYQIDATAAIQTLVTLGTPHSGISGSEVADSSGAVQMPPGQDSLSFKACDQLSCYVMGQEIFSDFSRRTSLLSILGVQSEPGEQVTRMTKTLGMLPSIPIIVGIGLTTDRIDNSVYDAGDYLISFRGQRFQPADVSANFRHGAKVGSAKIIETLLGEVDDRGPGDSRSTTAASATRNLGYLHSSLTGSSNLLDNISDGEEGFGLEAAVEKNCNTAATCTHASYILFKRLMADDFCDLKELGCTVFRDDFNRNDGPVGNGWLADPNSAGGNLTVMKGKLTTPLQSGVMTIYRKIDSSKGTTVTATITETNDNAINGGRLGSSIWIGSTGKYLTGYGLHFSRSGTNHNNSAVVLMLNGVTIRSIPSTFQFGRTIDVNATFEVNGTVRGAVRGDGNSFEFNFGPSSVDISKLPGGNLLVELENGNCCLQPTLDNIVIGPAENFAESFDGTALKDANWTSIGAGSISISGGLATLSCGGHANTKGKLEISGDKGIVIESRFVGAGSSRSSGLSLYDVLRDTTDAVAFGDTNYSAPNATPGMFLNGSGAFATPRQFGSGTSVGTFKEYRMSIVDKTVKVERGETLASISDSYTVTLPTSIIGRKFYLSFWSGTAPYCPGTQFDWIRVSNP